MPVKAKKTEILAPQKCEVLKSVKNSYPFAKYNIRQFKKQLELKISRCFTP